jgi:EmrB/QacA subfamily drug resistance transporter
MMSARARPCDEAAIRSVHPTSECVASSKFWVLLVTILGSTISFIDESVVNVALPAIEADLQTSAVVVQWLINAYTLCLAALLLIGGASGDRFGRRRIFVIGVAIFAAASLWCGLAPSIFQLIAARAVQGVGAALLVPCSLAIIGASFEEKERGRAIGTWAGFSAIAAAIGPLLGGFIVDHLSWRWIFLINPPLALFTIWAALTHVPESHDPEAKSGLDVTGAILVFAGLGSLVFGVIETSVRGWTDPVVMTTIVTGLALIAAFLWVERRSAAPMMPLRLFRSRTFSGINLLTLLLYGALGGAFFFLPFDLIQVHGYSATLAGSVFLPFTVIMGVLSRWSGGLLDRFGARLPLTVGPAIVAAGFALLALLPTDSPYWLGFLMPMVILGFGMAVSVAPLTTTVINAVPGHQTGVASGVNNAVASVASLLAVSLFGSIALTLHDRTLDQRMADQALPAGIQHAIEAAHGKFVLEPALTDVAGEDRETAQAMIRQSLATSIRVAMALAAVLALGGAVTSAVTIGSGSNRSNE